MKFRELQNYSLRLAILATAAASILLVGQFDFITVYFSAGAILNGLIRPNNHPGYELFVILLPLLAVGLSLLRPHPLQIVLVFKIVIPLVMLTIQNFFSMLFFLD